MAQELRPDLCIIGAGAGGMAVAAAAAALAVPAVLVERAEMGAMALKDGAIPSHFLAAAARTAQALRTADRFGIDAVEPTVDLAKVRAARLELASAIGRDRSQARLEAMNLRVIPASARFTARDRVEAGGFVIRARRTIIATGSSPIIPAIPGLEQVRYLTSESLFDLARMPQRLAVIGATANGLELAQAIRRLGGDVIVFDQGRALAAEDEELASIVLAALSAEGVVLRENTMIRRIEPHGDGVRLFLATGGAEETIDASHVLVAAGRTPNVEGLGLEAAGIVFSKSGIRVGRDMRTTNRRVYAVGDATGLGQTVEAATYHAGIALRAALFRQRGRFQPEMVSRVVYTDPELAVAGLSEAQARVGHGAVRVLRSAFAENDRARLERGTNGHVKVVTDKNGTILGAAIVGPHAGELIGLWQLAISKAIKVGELADLVIPYPTLSEVSRRLAVTSWAETLRNPWLRRGMQWLRRLG